MTTILSSQLHQVVSLQDLVTREAIVEVPQCYVRQDMQPPARRRRAYPSVPSIDMNELATSDEELEKLYSSCRHWGLFQLVNHGVSSRVMEEMRMEIGGFFKLPMEEKMRYGIRPGFVEGYGHAVSRGDEKLDWGDRFYIITNPVERRKLHLFPQLPSSMREAFEAYFLELQKLAMTLLELLGRPLGMGKREIEELFDNGMQSVRMTYYPPCPQPERVLGLTPHSDASGITILFQANGVDGLQVRKDGEWFPVKFLEDSLAVNVGDVLEILSNGCYNSVEHRATVNSEKERISIAMFFNPKFESVFGPAERTVNPKNPALFKRMEMEDYVKCFFSRRLNGKTFLEHMRIKNEEETSDQSQP